jgi:hypothetical protein
MSWMMEGWNEFSEFWGYVVLCVQSLYFWTWLWELNIAMAPVEMLQQKKSDFKVHLQFTFKPWTDYTRNIIFNILYILLLNHFFTWLIWNMREVLVSWREKWNFFFADFHVLGLFMAKKHGLSNKKISVCHAPLPLYAKFVPRLQPRP